MPQPQVRATQLDGPASQQQPDQHGSNIAQTMEPINSRRPIPDALGQPATSELASYDTVLAATSLFAWMCWIHGLPSRPAARVRIARNHEAAHGALFATSLSTGGCDALCWAVDYQRFTRARESKLRNAVSTGRQSDQLRRELELGEYRGCTGRGEAASGSPELSMTTTALIAGCNRTPLQPARGHHLALHD